MAEEIRVADERVGFAVVCCDEKRAMLANVNSESDIRVGKYGVEVTGLESILDDLPELAPEDIFYLDEIGQMQLYSEKFRKTVREYLDKDNIMMGTISAIYDHGFINEVKQRDDVYVVTVTTENRGEIFEFIIQFLKKIKKSKRYITEPERFKRNGNIIHMNSEHSYRVLTLIENKWNCTCDFYKKYFICSHKMAADKLFKQ